MFLASKAGYAGGQGDATVSLMRYRHHTKNERITPSLEIRILYLCLPKSSTLQAHDSAFSRGPHHLVCDNAGSRAKCETVEISK